MNQKLIKIGMILAIICALLIFSVSIIYLIFGTLLTIVKVFLIVVTAFQGVTLLMMILLYVNQKRWLLIASITALFSLLIPGIILTVVYFQQVKNEATNQTKIDIK